MTKYVMLYYPGSKKPEMNQENFDKWTKWFDSFRDNMVDGGNPFKKGMETTKDGSKDIADDQWPATGYSIINAKDFEAANAIAQNCPYLDGSGDGVVRVFECANM